MLSRNILVALPLLLLCASEAAAEQMRGVVMTVDAANKELVLEGRGIGKRGKTYTFTFAKELSVTWDGKEAGIADLLVGQDVHVDYQVKNGDQLVNKIEIQGRRPAGSAKAAGDAVAGVLRRIAPTEREIIVATPSNGKETYTTLPLADDAKFTRDGKAITLDDLKEEESAAVKCEMRDGKKVAVLVEVGKVGDVKAVKPEGMSTIAKIRLGLKIADAVLDIVEKQQKK